MKPLFITALLALSLFGSTVGAHAQIATGHGAPVATKTFIDGCIVGTIRDVSLD